MSRSFLDGRFQLSILVKKKIVEGFIGLFLLWPFVHRALVAEYDVNPWRLFGFAMYCTPHRVGVRIADRTKGRGEMLSSRAQPQSVRDAVRLFYRKRAAFGMLHSPKRLADEIFASSPHIARLEVRVSLRRLDPSVSRLKVKTLVYQYARRNP